MNFTVEHDGKINSTLSGLPAPPSMEGRVWFHSYSILCRVGGVNAPHTLDSM